MITQFTVEFGINSTCNALNSIWLRLMLFRALLVLLIPNTTVNCAITYTNTIASLVTILIIYLFSVNTFTPIERCAIIFVIARVRKLLIGRVVQKLQNRANCNRVLIGQRGVSNGVSIATTHFYEKKCVVANAVQLRVCSVIDG